MNNTLIERMKSGETLKGFYFNLGKTEIFVKTDRKNKTEKLASEIFHELKNYGFQIPDNPDTRKELHYYLTPAYCEIKYFPGCDISPEPKHYFNIYHKNFSGYGSDDINDGKTIVIEL